MAQVEQHLALPRPRITQVFGWAATVMTPCGVVNCKVFGPQGPSLTNRMTELVTYGSVGGAGRKPGPYPAADVGGSARSTVSMACCRRHRSLESLSEYAHAYEARGLA